MLRQTCGKYMSNFCKNTLVQKKITTKTNGTRKTEKPEIVSGPICTEIDDARRYTRQNNTQVNRIFAHGRKTDKQTRCHSPVVPQSEIKSQLKL